MRGGESVEALIAIGNSQIPDLPAAHCTRHGCGAEQTDGRRGEGQNQRCRRLRQHKVPDSLQRGCAHGVRGLEDPSSTSSNELSTSRAI